MNVYQKYPQFVDSDTEIRKGQGGFDVTDEFLSTRYNILLSPDKLKGATVLDLGCTVGAAGAWVLEHGAKQYVGVELQTKISDAAQKNLTDCFPTHDWKIINTSLEQFLDTNTEKFDIVIATGVIHVCIHYQKLIDQISAVADTVVFDLRQQSFFHADNIDFSTLLYLNNVTDPELIPFTYYRKDTVMTHEDGHTINVTAALPSLGAVKLLFENQGFEADLTVHQELKKQIPDVYNIKRRYGCVFFRTSSPKQISFKDIYNS